MSATIAQRITRAVNEGDRDYATFIAANLEPAELRALVVELAGKVPAETAHVPINDVFDAVAAKYAINRADILSTNRKQEVARARQVACYAAHLLGYSQSHIARYVDRDHTTIWHAVVRVGEEPRMRDTAQHVARSFGWDKQKEAS